jgi:excisionase family DNA binding protein
MDANELLSISSLARLVNLPESWLRAEAVAGRIPCLRVGRKMRFNLSAVQHALLIRAAGEKEVADAE